MIKRFLSVGFLALAFLVIFPGLASAHQPRLVESDLVNVNNPEVSQAFYGELKGVQSEFRIKSAQDFRLYVGLLVPNIAGVKTDLSVEITRAGENGEELVAVLNGRDFNWTPFFEEFGRDNYFWGPEYSASDSQRGVALKGRLVSAGTYYIKVFSPKNEGKYSLVVGDLESFPINEALSAALILPGIKAQFFDDSFWTIIMSPFGWGYVLTLFILSFIFGWLYRKIFRHFAEVGNYKKSHNIGLPDRFFRAGLGVAVFILAVTTSWSPWLIFVSGFCFFEAVSSWCAVYAVIGKNTCHLN